MFIFIWNLYEIKIYKNMKVCKMLSLARYAHILHIWHEKECCLQSFTIRIVKGVLFTWRIQKHHILSDVNATSFHESSSDFLSSFMKLHTCSCTHRHSLQRKTAHYRQHCRFSYFATSFDVFLYFYLCIQKHIKRMVRICLSSPL